MPIKIDCPECGGSGYIAEYYEYDVDIDDVPKCSNCKDGKITVYTQEEIDKLKREIELRKRSVETQRKLIFKLTSQNEEMLEALKEVDNDMICRRIIKDFDIEYQILSKKVRALIQKVEKGE